MKLDMKYGKYIILLFIALLYASCSHDVVGPVGGTTAKLKINLSDVQQGIHNKTPYSDAMLNIDRIMAKAKNVSDTTTIDEVDLLVLDMTAWSNWNEFITAWEKTNQYGLLDTAIMNQMERENKDYWDIYSTVFKSYTGSAYKYVGDYAFLLDGGKASGTIYLNPGMNYFWYAFRASGKTLYEGEDVVVIKENEENTIQMGVVNATGSYSGSWTTAQGDTSDSLNLDVIDSSGTVYGKVTFGGMSCYTSFNVNGTLSSKSLNVWYNGSYYVYLYGTISGTTYSGSWYVSPACNGRSSGTFSMTRTSTTPNLKK